MFEILANSNEIRNTQDTKTNETVYEILVHIT